MRARRGSDRINRILADVARTTVGPPGAAPATAEPAPPSAERAPDHA
ncbi:MAG: hypothetical protein AAGA17_15750 [Actinomycetota bacterium]